MGRHATGPIVRLARTALSKASGLSLKIAVVAILAATAIVLGLVLFASPVLAFALALAVAVAWSLWLER
jgi:hypothetical protein